MILPGIQDFLKVWNEKWSTLPDGASAEERQRAFETIAVSMRLPTPEDVDTAAEHQVSSPSGPVRVRMFRHKSGGVQPCLVYFHGGGWVQGSPETHWDITSRIASFNRQTVISVDYALAPQRPFPAAVHHAEAATRWAFDNATALGLRRDRITVGGDSAGANLAAAVTLLLRGTSYPLAGQLLIYGAFDLSGTRPAGPAGGNRPEMMKGAPDVISMYVADPADRANPLVSPLRAASHANLPPAFVAVAENDGLKEGGLAYAAALRAAGVAVASDDGPGMIHGYLRGMEFCPEAMAKLRLMCGWLAGINGAVAAVA